MRLELAARVLKRLAQQGRLADLPPLPPSVMERLEAEESMLATALDRLSEPIRSGMAAMLLEIGEREQLLESPDPEEGLPAQQPHEDEENQDEAWASVAEALIPSHTPEIRLLRRSDDPRVGVLPPSLTGVGIVSYDVHEARAELSRALPYGSFVPLNTRPVSGTDPKSAVLQAVEAPNWPPVAPGDRGVGVIIYENDAIVVRTLTDDDLFNSHAADLLIATCGENALLFFVPGSSRFTAILRKTHPSLVGFFAELRRDSQSLLTIGRPGSEPIPVSGRAPNGRPLCRYVRPSAKSGTTNYTLEDLRRYVARLCDDFPDVQVLPESACGRRDVRHEPSVRRTLPNALWARETLLVYGLAPYNRFASGHMPFDDPALIAAIEHRPDGTHRF